MALYIGESSITDTPIRRLPICRLDLYHWSIPWLDGPHCIACRYCITRWYLGSPISQPPIFWSLICQFADRQYSNRWYGNQIWIIDLPSDPMATIAHHGSLSLWLGVSSLWHLLIPIADADISNRLSFSLIPEITHLPSSNPIHQRSLIRGSKGLALSSPFGLLRLRFAL